MAFCVDEAGVGDGLRPGYPVPAADGKLRVPEILISPLPPKASVGKNLVFNAIQGGSRCKEQILREFFTEIRQQGSYGHLIAVLTSWRS
jgi:hypothetical protein